MPERFVFASDCFDLHWNLRKFGIAMAARIPMIATTIISSTRVKPSFFVARMASPLADGAKWLRKILSRNSIPCRRVERDRGTYVADGGSSTVKTDPLPG